MPKNKQPDKTEANGNREFLAAAITPATLDADKRTVDCVWFTGIDVPRYDWYKGEPYILRFDLDGADMTLLNSGAPVFDNHDSYGGASAQKGVVEKAWREKSEFKATLRFSRRGEVDGLWQDISDGIVQKFSMGVNLLEKKDTPAQKDKMRVVTVTKWQPFEISTAPLPADQNTRTLAEERAATNVGRATSPQEQVMEPETVKSAGELAREEPKQPPPPVVADEQLNSARNTGAVGEQARITTIMKVGEVCGCSMNFIKKHINENTSVDAFRKHAIDDQAQRGAAGVNVRTAHVDILRDESDTRRRNMTGALLERFDPGRWSYEENFGFLFQPMGGKRMYEGSRPYASLTLLDVAKECLAAQGINWRDKSRTEIAQLAFQSTSDFPFILADAANKTLRAGYDMVPAQWRLIAARRTAPDFKTVKELTLDSNSRLELVRESGEFKRGKLVEGKESWGLSTYGKVISITRQAIINDDLGAFTRTPQLMGQEVAMLEADTVFGIITTNGNMRDGNALFSVAHNNLVDSGATISIDELGDTRKLMLVQTSPGGKTLGISPKYLLAPAALAQLAEQYTSTAYQSATPANINPLAGRLTPIIEPRLDTNSDKKWYLFGDPNMPNSAVLIYAYLEGQEGPYTETRNGFDVDGVEIKIRHDFAAAAIDHRGAVQNDGE